MSYGCYGDRSADSVPIISALFDAGARRHPQRGNRLRASAAGLIRCASRARLLQLASERDPRRVLDLVRQHRQPEQTVFVGVTDPIHPTVETPEQVRDRVLLAAEYLPMPNLGTTGDCGFAPFADDTSTSREIAFEKIRARVAGTALAAQQLIRT